MSGYVYTFLGFAFLRSLSLLFVLITSRRANQRIRQIAPCSASSCTNSAMLAFPDLISIFLRWVFTV
jgi:hypothetical protein